MSKLPLLALAAVTALAAAPLELRFAEPADDALNEGLPLGNGRLGMLVPGQVENERIVLNEDSVWSGWVQKGAANSAAAEALPEIRARLFAGDVAGAQKLVEATQLPNMVDAQGRDFGGAYGTFQMLAFLDLAFALPEGAVEDYERVLDLATATVRFTQGGLAECAVPLLDLLHGMVASGAETARVPHGTRGWTLHTLHNPWGFTAPGWEASWGQTSQSCSSDC